MKHHVHSLNSSPAKQKYSFSKASRFSTIKASTDVSYLPTISHDRRSAIMGYGERSLTHDRNKARYPHAYQLPSSFNSKSGNSLKAGRYQFGGPMQSVKRGKETPGPNYTIPSTLQKKGATLKPRLEDYSNKYQKSIPGPGAYLLPSSISNGEKNIFDSKYSYSGSVKIPPKEAHSVEIRKPNYQKPEIPGPGQYDIMKYGVSNPETAPYKRYGNTKFGHQQRNIIDTKQSRKIPGPGAYKIYSEFDD